MGKWYYAARRRCFRGTPNRRNRRSFFSTSHRTIINRTLLARGEIIPCLLLHTDCNFNPYLRWHDVGEFRLLSYEIILPLRLQARGSCLPVSSHPLLLLARLIRGRGARSDMYSGCCTLFSRA